MIKRILGLLLILSIVACSKKKPNTPAPEPTAATPLLPVKDQACATGTVISATESSVGFSWTAGQNTDSYDLSIKNLLTGTETTQPVTGSQANVTLLRNTPYSWYVTAKSKSNSTTAKGAVWKFYNAGAGIITYAPFPAELLSPVLGQIVTSTSGQVNITWRGSIVTGGSPIASYSVYFGPSSNPALYKAQTTDTFINNISVGANTTYYWHVVSIDGNNNAADSGINSFFVK